MDELEAIRSGIQNYADYTKETDYKPKIVLLVAVKRHNKRFFTEIEKGKFCLFVFKNFLRYQVLNY